jgi:hypothetical protein
MKIHTFKTKAFFIALLIFCVLISTLRTVWILHEWHETGIIVLDDVDVIIDSVQCLLNGDICMPNMICQFDHTIDGNPLYFGLEIYGRHRFSKSLPKNQLP